MIIGMSFYYIRYSTWKGRFLFLEDFQAQNKKNFYYEFYLEKLNK